MGLQPTYKPFTNFLGHPSRFTLKGGLKHLFCSFTHLFFPGESWDFQVDLWHVHVVLNGEWGENPPTIASLKGDWGNWNCDTSFAYQVSNWNCDTLFVKNHIFFHSLIKSTLEVVRPDPSRNYSLSPNFGRRERWIGETASFFSRMKHALVASPTPTPTQNRVETMMKMKGWCEVNGIYRLLAAGYRHFNLLVFGHLTHHFHYFFKCWNFSSFFWGRVRSILVSTGFSYLQPLQSPQTCQRAVVFFFALGLFILRKKLGFSAEEAFKFK